MGYSIKYLNNTSSPVEVTVTSTTEFTGYTGSVTIAAYDAVTTSTAVQELDIAAGLQTIDKYLNGQKVYCPGPTGYLGSFGAAGYTGSRGATGATGA
jgi:hypothetical protein